MDRLLSVPDAKAKSILLALCSDDGSLAHRASEFLDLIETLEKKPPTLDPANLKRKATSEIKICVQCQEPFYEEENGDKACTYHDGDLEEDSDSDVWADHDENCHGPIDTVENRMDFPEGFIWSCCQKLGHRRGCTKGRHSVASGQRGKYGVARGIWSEKDEPESNEEGSENESEDDQEL
ncbi:hypothetical protein SAMD00023353_2700310 [Rosellinia necatrix]|uniref:Uncharacterized protein n=1 Tax=Rosellinia necatrix TaxID=77044 RepID=A0A1W2TGZ8_ROSNE|nr:hypothetical protein SAMD00023353_2700310 [Rosellinia necatrix]